MYYCPAGHFGFLFKPYVVIFLCRCACSEALYYVRIHLSFFHALSFCIEVIIQVHLKAEGLIAWGPPHWLLHRFVLLSGID